MEKKSKARGGRKNSARRKAVAPVSAGVSTKPAAKPRRANGALARTSRAPSVSREQLAVQPPARRMRTPRPPAAPALEDVRPQGPGAAVLADRMEQLRHLQDFFHNPVPFDLRERPLESSSPPEEIVRRMGEVQYQIDVLNALLVVLSEEMEALNGALPADVEERLQGSAEPAQT